MGKITEQELQSVTKLKDETTEIISNLGQLEYQKISIDFAVQQLKLRITELKEREAEILGNLRQKYGNVAINIETGEF